MASLTVTGRRLNAIPSVGTSGTQRRRFIVLEALRIHPIVIHLISMIEFIHSALSVLGAKREDVCITHVVLNSEQALVSIDK